VRGGGFTTSQVACSHKKSVGKGSVKISLLIVTLENGGRKESWGKVGGEIISGGRHCIHY